MDTLQYILLYFTIFFYNFLIVRFFFCYFLFWLILFSKVWYWSKCLQFSVTTTIKKYIFQQISLTHLPVDPRCTAMCVRLSTLSHIYFHILSCCVSVIYSFSLVTSHLFSFHFWCDCFTNYVNNDTDTVRTINTITFCLNNESKYWKM